MGAQWDKWVARLKAATWDDENPNESRKQWLARGLVALLAILAVIGAVAVNIPTKGVGAAKEEDLPAIALGQSLIYRTEIGLLIFYWGLLLLTVQPRSGGWHPDYSDCF